MSGKGSSVPLSSSFESHLNAELMVVVHELDIDLYWICCL